MPANIQSLHEAFPPREPASNALIYKDLWNKS
jgi:hypothetical protein